MTKPLKQQVKEKMIGDNINVADLSALTGIPAARIYKWYDTRKPANPKEADAVILNKWLNSSNSSNEKVLIDEIEQSAKAQPPLIQVVVNLSYIGKKNADSIDKMADSNLLNAKSIATLVSLIANSDLASLLMQEPSSQHTGDDLPAEAFLGKEGNDFLKRQKQAGKNALKSK